MSRPPSEPRTWRVRRRHAAAAAWLLACLATSALLVDHGPEPRLTAAGLQAYESELAPLVRQGGKTVQLGIKPGIDDLRFRHVVPAALIAREADAWVEDLTEVRSKIAQLVADPALGPVTEAFVRALDRYVLASTSFRDAALAPQPAGRLDLINDGIHLAQQGDRLYDRASAQLQALRLRLGLPASLNFPSPATRSDP